MKKTMLVLLIAAAITAAGCSSKPASSTSGSSSSTASSSAASSGTSSSEASNPSSSTPSGSTFMPNPMTEHVTVEEAAKAIGIDAHLPAYLPEGYVQSKVFTYEGGLLEVDYGKGENILFYRTAMKSDSLSDDISGVYEDFPEHTDMTISGTVKAAVKGKAGRYYVGNMERDGQIFCIYSQAGLTLDEMHKIFTSIK